MNMAAKIRVTVISSIDGIELAGSGLEVYPGSRLEINAFMRIDVYAAPGEGASDALLDWLEKNEVVATVHDVRGEAELAEALSLGGIRFPMTRVDGRIVRGFDPAAIDSLLHTEDEEGAGIELAVDGEGHPVVAEVAEGSIADAAGLQVGDVIVELSGYSSFSLDQLEGVLAARRPVVLGVRRGADQFRVSLAEERLAA